MSSSKRSANQTPVFLMSVELESVMLHVPNFFFQCTFSLPLCPTNGQGNSRASSVDWCSSFSHLSFPITRPVQCTRQLRVWPNVWKWRTMVSQESSCKFDSAKPFEIFFHFCRFASCEKMLLQPSFWRTVIVVAPHHLMSDVGQVSVKSTVNFIN